METKRLNILHLTNTLGMGGVEKIIYQICQVTQDEFEGFMQHQQEVYLLINSNILG